MTTYNHIPQHALFVPLPTALAKIREIEVAGYHIDFDRDRPARDRRAAMVAEMAARIEAGGVVGTYRCRIGHPDSLAHLDVMIGLPATGRVTVAIRSDYSDRYPSHEITVLTCPHGARRDWTWVPSRWEWVPNAITNEAAFPWTNFGPTLKRLVPQIAVVLTADLQTPRDDFSWGFPNPRGGNPWAVRLDPGRHTATIYRAHSRRADNAA
jgi:hypothetical protein